MSSIEIPNRPAAANSAFRPFDRVQSVLLGGAVISQAVTVWMTWPLWLVRESGMPNLPVFSVLELDFGILMIGSLLMVVIHPRSGVWIHLLVLFIATLFDQTRCGPNRNFWPAGF